MDNPLLMPSGRHMHSAIVENSKDFIALATFKGRMLFLNAGGRRMVGFELDEDISSHRTLDFHFKDYESLFHDEVLPKVASTGYWAGRTKLRNRSTGASINVMANCFHVTDSESDEPVCLGLIQKEIGEYEDLRTSEERLSMAIRATSDGVWDCDLVNDSVWWNDRYDALYGTRPADTAGSWQWWIDRIHPDDRERVANSLKSVVDSPADYGDRWEAEYRFKTRDGSYAHVCDRAVIARNSSGVATRILGAMQDVTALKQSQHNLEKSNAQLANTVNELRQSERKVIQQERLSAMGEMASGVSHNLNNLLSPSVLLIDVVLDDPALSKESRRALKLIKSSADDAAELVGRLGSLYGNENASVEMVSLDLKPLVGELPPLTKAKWHDGTRISGSKITIDLQLDDVPVVQGNAADLRQVLTNLIFNAVDASPSGGTIGLRLFHDKTSVVIEVSDTGQGMTDEEQAKCFEPFFTTKHNGSGLGLATCAEIIKQHGGSITAKSSRGDGTTFRIDIPVATSTIVQAAHSVRNSVITRPLRVLYIDDDPALLQTMEFLLKQYGHKVDIANGGPAGLLAVQENDYDVVISDFTMPEMNGREVAAAVKAIRPETHVVLITGWPVSHLASAAAEGAKEDCLMRKPMKIEQLNAVLNDIQR